MSACVFFSQQPSGLFSVSLPQTETAARSTSQVNSHSCWLALHQHHTHRNVNVSRSTNKPDQKQGSQIPLGEPMLCCLVCFSAPPRPQVYVGGSSKQAAAWPPPDCPPCPLRAGSPSQNSPFSLPAPAATVHARQTLAFTTQPLPLPSLRELFMPHSHRVKKKPYSPLQAVECEFLQKFQRC